MRKIMMLFSACALAFLFTGCQSADRHITKPSEGTVAHTAVPSEALPQLVEAELIVNGKKLPKNNCVGIDTQSKNTVLPLLEVLKELGAEVRWRDTNVVVIEHRGTVVELNANKDDFGILIPPGTIGAVRRVVNAELIIDGDSVQSLLANIMEAEIKVVEQTSTIYITSRIEDCAVP